MVESIADIENKEHFDENSLKRIVLYGKTSGDEYVEVLVDDNGVLQVA